MSAIEDVGARRKKPLRDARTGCLQHKFFVLTIQDSFTIISESLVSQDGETYSGITNIGQVARALLSDLVDI